jgi:5'-methylthioinosine phosphorylase
MKPNSPTIAVITGTGATEHFRLSASRKVETEYGAVEAYTSAEGPFYVLPRHGQGHVVPPHRVNYRANIAALDKLGVTAVFSTTAVGTMGNKIRVGELGVIDQFLDFTKARPGTFFDSKVVHADMTHPYSAELNAALAAGAKAIGVRLRNKLVYVCVEGPRFETSAEIKMFKELGGDVVGMTGVPEVVLANELGMKYATIAIATNWAAGMQRNVSHEEVLRVMKRSGARVKKLLLKAITLL